LVGRVLNQLVFPLAFAAETAVSSKIATDLGRRPLAVLLGRRALVVHNAIDRTRFQNVSVDVAAKRKSLGLAVGAPVLGNVARFSPQKGHAHLIEAMNLVVQRRPDCQLLLVGGGELLPEIRTQVAELGLSSLVRFVGTRTDIEELYSVMDVYVSASLWEGLSTVVLEAMAASVPVVCTAVSGSAEMVDDGRSGIVVPPASPRDLAAAIIDLLDHPEKACRLASEANETARRFSIERAASEYSQLFLSQSWRYSGCQG
jgi:glycosyltransferase involved in cell wall biosynthesis